MFDWLFLARRLGAGTKGMIHRETWADRELPDTTGKAARATTRAATRNKKECPNGCLAARDTQHAMTPSPGDNNGFEGDLLPRQSFAWILFAVHSFCAPKRNSGGDDDAYWETGLRHEQEEEGE